MKLKKLIFSDRFFKVLLFVSIAIYLVLAMQIPVSINPRAVHDDGLFYKLAKNILLGQWLGDYNDPCYSPHLSLEDTNFSYASNSRKSSLDLIK